MDTKFPKTMAAMAEVDRSTWDVAYALLDEVQMDAKGTRAARGAYEGIVKDATKRGFTNPSTGKSYSTTHLAQLRNVAAATSRSESSDEFAEYPITRVREALGKHGFDSPDRALAQLRKGKKSKDFTGRQPMPKVNDRPDPVAAIKAAPTKARIEAAKEALQDPDVIREVVRDEKLQEAMSEARLDDAYRKSTGKSIRPSGGTKKQEEEEEGLLRPGLAFLAIGGELYKARTADIAALRHARESEITDALKRLIKTDIEAQREILLDLEVVIEGGEVSDEELASFVTESEDHRDKWEEVK